MPQHKEEKPMRPALWQPPISLAPAEEGVIRRIRRAKLFVWLREHRHELFDADFQAELATMYAASTVGHPAVPPAQLALATILQAYTGVSDEEVVEAAALDARWQLVLGCLGAEAAPFSKATLVAFRERLLATGMDRRLVERTVTLAKARGGFGDRALRAALDSSPLWGAGRVEDTYNLLGHALRRAVGMLARQQGRELAALAAEAGAGVEAGPASLKAALDLDWDDPAARAVALGQVLQALAQAEQWLAERALPPPAPLGIARQVVAQDVTRAPDGQPRLRDGVAPDRRISLEDGAMRHGRKSRSRRVDGYKRHVLRDLDSGLVRAVGLTPANAPEASATAALLADLAAQHARLAELHIDRAYLSSPLVRERPADLQVFCKAWPVRNAGRFPKTAFHLDWARGVLTCPHQVTLPFAPGGTVHFPAATCAACPLQARCTASPHGRSVHIHPDERLLAELRTRQQTAEGRARLRERVAVEHSLAHIGHWQGWRARYRGLRKNLFDLRRAAVVHNLFILRHLEQTAAA
jgi:transposase